MRTVTDEIFQENDHGSFDSSNTVDTSAETDLGQKIHYPARYWGRDFQPASVRCMSDDCRSVAVEDGVAGSRLRRNHPLPPRRGSYWQFSALCLRIGQSIASHVGCIKACAFGRPSADLNRTYSVRKKIVISAGGTFFDLVTEFS